MFNVVSKSRQQSTRLRRIKNAVHIDYIKLSFRFQHELFKKIFTKYLMCYLMFLLPPLPYKKTSRGEENVIGGSGGASGKDLDTNRLEHGPRPHGSPS